MTDAGRSVAMIEHDVVIAGGGPTGLMLAAELALASIDVAIVEHREAPDTSRARAGGLHARTIEIFDQRGTVDRFLAEGQVAQVAAFAGVRLDISDFPTRHNYGLALPQAQTERILADWVGELGVPIQRGREVTGFTQDETGVEVRTSDGSMRAAYLVGCDGGRSLVRKTAGVEFPGTDATTSNLIADVELAEEPPEWGIRRDAVGIHALSKQDDGRVGVLVTERAVGGTTPPTLDDLREEMIAVYGTDFGVHSPASLSRFTDAVRQAATYRERRVLLAGDAAHIHPPDGGQGLQLGVHDAVNLGWKLAAVVKGTAPETLLDTYQAERHPAAARILRTILASVAFRREDERTGAMREIVAEVLGMDEPRRRLAARMSGLDVHYDIGHGHPDLDLATAGGPSRVYELLHDARPLLLNLGEPGALEIGEWADRVRVTDATSAGPWELPAIGAVEAAEAVLVRPDGYVAWVGDHWREGLEAALTAWFGPAAATDRAESRSVLA